LKILLINIARSAGDIKNKYVLCTKKINFYFIDFIIFYVIIVRTYKK